METLLILPCIMSGHKLTNKLDNLVPAGRSATES